LSYIRNEIPDAGQASSRVIARSGYRAANRVGVTAPSTSVPLTSPADRVGRDRGVRVRTSRETRGYHQCLSW